ncbi:MAG: type IX secretion system sortase PorU [Bacteroidetes Order II. Incertae sedis bacterium]|nr:type IX secretion system sortase PorU [Bacteroidetes Order II. bacterium]
MLSRFFSLFGLQLIATLASALYGQQAHIERLSQDANQAIFRIHTSWKSEVNPENLKAKTAEQILIALTDGWAIVSEQISLPTHALPTIEVSGTRFETISVQNIAHKTLFEGYVNDLASIGQLGIERKKPTATLTANLLSYDKEQGLLYRYTEYLITVRFGKNDVLSKKETCSNAHVATTKSVLAQGRWFRFPVTEEGLYKIDAAYLQGLGVTGTIDWTKVQIYGNGGKMLPAKNCDPRPGDLTPISVSVLSDGLVFYGNGPKGWIYNADQNLWEHFSHDFSNENIYFIRVDETAPTLVKAALAPNQNNPVTLTQTTGRWFKEEDKINIGGDSGSGLDWLGQEVLGGGSVTVVDQVFDGLASGTVQYRARIAARANPGAQVSVISGNNTLHQFTSRIVDLNQSLGVKASEESFSFTHTAVTGSKQTIQFRLAKTDNDPRFWMDWIAAFYPQDLVAANQYLRFATPTGEKGEIIFALSGFASTPTVWDITDGKDTRQLPVSESGGKYLVRMNIADTPRELVAFVPTAITYKKPATGSAVANQNLHGITTIPAFVIVTPTEFKSQAENLAQYRRSQGITTEVVEIHQIINEFSGGVMDMRAMRDYFKFLYDKDTQDVFKYVLLFGDGHFDYRNINGTTNTLKNWIPVYQTDESFDEITSFTSDDYFGLLDDQEGEWRWLFDSSSSFERMDIGIGRFVVQSTAQAAGVIQKIKHYENPKNLGAWRTRFTFIADDEIAGSRQPESDLHTQNADMIARMLEDIAPDFNLHKIYAMSYNPVTTVNGRRVPEAKDEIFRAFNEGTLVWNYSGHGGYEALADEKLVLLEDLNELANLDTLPIIVTATCSFGHWDYADKQSGAEVAFLNADGGAIAVFTTVRPVYTTSSLDSLNPGLNRQLTIQMVTREPNGLPQRFGDVLRKTKNTTAGSQDNNRKFNLFGDPTMRVGLPTLKTVVSTINEKPLTDNLQIKALDKVVVKGEVVQQNGQRATDFSGKVDLMVYDAPRQVTLRDAQYLPGGQYKVYRDLIFRGRASVKNGEYTLTFVAPKDISYSNTNGRISLYAAGAQTDAIGHSLRIVIGGTATNPIKDLKGPEVQLFLNDTTFVSGGITHKKPRLIAKLFDENGLNTVGTGIGHELLLVINGDEQNARNLSEFFVGNENSYQRGMVSYALPELAPGTHTLTLKAWDVSNNSSLATLDFVVADEQQLEIRNLANYPNPTMGPTRFVLEHNQIPGRTARAEIKIFSLSGRLIRTIGTDELLPGGVLTGSTLQYQWDGKDEDGDAPAMGVYLYKAKIEITDETSEIPTKQTAELIEKMAIIR